MAEKPKPSLRDKPTEQDLRDIASPAIKAWKKLMTNLGLDDTDISRFSINNRHDEAEACFQGLLYWLQENAAVPATWETLVKALKKSNLGQIVSKSQTWPHLLSDSMVEQGVRRMEDKPLSQDEKVQAIVGLYLKKQVFMPRKAELVREFSKIMGELSVALDPQKSSLEARLCVKGAVNEMYKSISEGMLPQPSPSPDPDNLFEFISQRSDPYQPFLVEEAIEGLNKHKLKKRFTKYKEDLKSWMETKITDLKSDNIVLPDLSPREFCLAMCTSVSKDQVLLSFFYEMHDFLKIILKLDCSRLLGMQTGCTIVYFIISAVDVDLFEHTILSHLTEMKEKFSLTYVVVIDHFVVDVERGTLEVLPPSASMIQEDFHIGTEEPEGSVKALALQLSEAKLERHQTPGQLDDVDVQAERDLLKDTIAELEPQVLDRAWPVHGAIPISASVLCGNERSSTSERQQADRQDFNVGKFMEKYKTEFLGSVEVWLIDEVSLKTFFQGATPNLLGAPDYLFYHIHDNGTPDMIRRLCHFMMDQISKCRALFKTILDDLDQRLPQSTSISLPQNESFGNKDHHDFDMQTFMEKYEEEFFPSRFAALIPKPYWFGDHPLEAAMLIDSEDFVPGHMLGITFVDVSYKLFLRLSRSGTPDMIRRLCHFMMDWSRPQIRQTCIPPQFI